MNYVKTLEMTREDWLRARQQGIGSSDVGAILGMSEYRTALDVYNEKTAPAPIDIPMNAAMEFGLRLEQVVAEKYAEETGRRVLRDNKIRIHEEYPFLMCNLDRVILPENGEGRGILEIKTSSGMAVRHWEDEVPLPYYAQIQHQLSVTGLSWGVFALLVDGREFRAIPVRRDDAYIQSQTELLVRFWNSHVAARVPPPAIARDLELMRSTPESLAEASVDIIDVHSQLVAVKEELATLKGRQETLENRIKEFMGLREILANEGHCLATWKSSKPSVTIDAKRLQKEMPDVFEKFSVTRPGSRRFYLKGTTNDLD